MLELRSDLFGSLPFDEDTAGAVSGTQLHRREVTLLAGTVQRRGAVGAGTVHLRARAEHSRSHLSVTIQAGEAQRRVAVCICKVHLRAGVEQPRRQLRVTILAGDV